jgi:iron complex transport system permease protein
MDHNARATLRKTLIVCGALTAMLVFIAIIAATLGSERVPVVDVLRVLFTGGSDTGALTSTQRAIIFDIRLPRILLAATVGASLAAAGASYQALLRNALAEPYLLGISNGAAVGTMVALVFLGANDWTRPVPAFVGALTALIGAPLFIYLIKRR